MKSSRKAPGNKHEKGKKKPFKDITAQILLNSQINTIHQVHNAENRNSKKATMQYTELNPNK
jgi:hypothetical protein